jgi:ubiquinone biosynthesis protein COQ9
MYGTLEIVVSSTILRLVPQIGWSDGLASAGTSLHFAHNPISRHARLSGFRDLPVFVGMEYVDPEMWP